MGSLGLCFAATRVMVAGTQKLHVFQHGGIGSAVANWNQYSFGFACGSFQ